MAGNIILSSSSFDESTSASHPSLLPSSSPRPRLRQPPVVVSSSSFCCPRRRPRRPPPVPPRLNLSVSADAAADDLSRARETPAYLWRKDEKWHPVSYHGFSPSTASAAASLSRRHLQRNHNSLAFSSDDEDDEEEESFEMTELRLRRAAMMEGAKPADGMAVVKRSEDPRSDFRRSMAEMVVEKGIFEAKDLEQLLQCFLSLNSQQHHQAIVDAFTDVWVALFPATPFGRSPGQGSSTTSVTLHVAE